MLGTATGMEETVGRYRVPAAGILFADESNNSNDNYAGRMMLDEWQQVQWRRALWYNRGILQVSTLEREGSEMKFAW